MSLAVGTACAINDYSDRIEIFWTSDSSGDVLYFLERELDCVLWKMTTIPLDSPSANYTVKLLTPNGYNVLVSTNSVIIAGLSSSAPEEELLYRTSGDGSSTPANHELGVPVRGWFRFQIAAAGNTKSGRVILWKR